MAKASVAATIDAIYGHVGTLTFSLGANGQYTVGRPGWKQTRTPRQTAAAGAWTNMIKAWATTLTDADRSAWATFGQTNGTTNPCGNSVPISGFAAFARSNISLSNAGATTRTAPPSSWGYTDPGTCTLSYTPGQPPTLEITPTTKPTHSDIPIVRGAPPRLAGSPQVKHNLTYLSVGTQGARPPYDVGQQYEAIFGTIHTGQLIQLTLEYCDQTSGARSPLRPAQLVIP